ncbi:hypothetical protein [Aurantibacillus circumpalustris]|uniref:hypothetical protein n=1 Tax=Aurantibacillus circumpalustris TaxID=3036359 RepID=UPI00295BBF84|nr:hypothetical protein [Aurantibacillus circumpalustris]
MKSKFKQIFSILFLSISFLGLSQTVEKIKFKKDRSLIYFFQKGAKSDTLYRGNENLFYLVVPENLKRDLSIQVENGQLMTSGNDSIVSLIYLPGFQYESFYESKEIKGEKKQKKVQYNFTTLVNGTSIIKAPKISISIINKSTGGLILENVFLYGND